MLAGTPRKLEDLMVEQLTYIASLQPAETRKIMEDNVENAKADAIKVKNLSKSNKDTAEKDQKPFNISAPYWISLNNYDPIEEAKRLKQPLLILQGSSDYQVTQEGDFALWKKELQKPNV